ncbi:MAG: polyphosphate kinase 1 [Proteobacteria bacterium]|nr:polyphosphate kinase 1 [Pseudomonadota bacterium]
MSPPLGDQRYFNRELSWLAFERRVLALAEDPAVPLLERVKFVAIFHQNLDEFFQIRVAGLREQRDAGVELRSPDGLTAEAQLREIRKVVLELTARAQHLFVKDLLPALAEADVHVVPLASLRDEERRALERFFEERVFPVLTPLAVDPSHPFPHISNLSLNLAVLAQEPGREGHRFARVKVPALLPRLVPLGDGERFVWLEELIAHRISALFPGLEIVACDPFRVTRDADLDVEEDEADDLLEAIASGLRRRERQSAVVRVEIDARMSDEVRELLMEELELSSADVYVQTEPLDLGALWALHGLRRPELKDEPWKPRTPIALASALETDEGLFDLMRRTDILVQHPYDAFSTSVEALLERAAGDPNVLAIKHTLYRTSGPDTSTFRSLMRAAESGKQVVTLVELKARFDEQTNIEWARTLERAGVHVVYGVVGLKTHAKVTLIVRQEGESIRRYCHVGTGNYNPVTARLYEDVGILSARPELGDDLTHFFNHLTGASHHRRYRKLLVAPDQLRPALIERIQREAEADDGHIVIKVNNISDPELIDALYEASRRGTEIDLIVRGICTLRPGLPGLSESVRVRSILGSFLEHSRVFRFGSAERGRDYFIGSSDLMPRNLSRRVEAVVPVEDPPLQERLEEILSLCLEDAGFCWTLAGDGSWSRVTRGSEPDLQTRLRQRAIRRSTPVSG